MYRKCNRQGRETIGCQIEKHWISYAGTNNQEYFCKTWGYVAYERDSLISHPLSLYKIPC